MADSGHKPERRQPLIKRLGSFRAEISIDGQHMYSITAPQDEQPVYLQANLLQVTEAAQIVYSAAFIMARRSGSPIPPLIAENFAVQPEHQDSIFHYDPRTRKFLVTWHFNDRPPLPWSMSLEDYLRMTSSCDALCGVVR